MFFIVGLPSFMFLVFGLGDDERVGSGNVAMYVMISMASYGAVTATTGVAGSAATEQVMGWGRQLGAHADARRSPSSRPRPRIAMVVALMPIALIFAIGAATGARGDAERLAARGRARVARVGALRDLRPGDVAWPSAAPTPPASRRG